MARRKRKTAVITLFIVGLLLLSLVGSTVQAWVSPKSMKIGATFSYVYARNLGLDWREAYMAVLSELELESLRIPIYWSEIEKTKDELDYQDIDWMLDQALAHDIDVTLAIGVKVPRWPECFIPDWVTYGSTEDSRIELFDYLEATVERYREHPALERWQVENEVYFPFGHCPMPRPERIDQERELVRQLDPSHPIQLTTSGEQALWFTTAIPADVLGVSLYRITWNDWIGFIVFPHRPVLYSAQHTIASLFADEVIISELQAEPWIASFMHDWSAKDQYEAFTAQDLERNLWFAKRTRATEVFLWGIEWWYYLKQQGDTRLWDAGKVQIQNMIQ